jgi:DNA-binding response OmpR family regulator
MQRALPRAPVSEPQNGASITRARILIVEDEYVVALETAAALDEAGFAVAGIAASAEEALRLAGAEPLDLAIMDVTLAGRRDGASAARELYERHGVRSIMATAHLDAPTRARAGPEAPLGWLAKPFTSAALVAFVRKSLTRTR